MLGKKVFIYPTMLCNLKCKFCYSNSPTQKGDHNYELSLNEYIKLFKGLYQYGVRVFDISGGEPLFRKDLYEICGAIKEYDDTRIYVTSNGTLIQNFIPFLDRLLSKIDRINLSLDSSIPEIHNRLRGLKVLMRRL